MAELAKHQGIDARALAFTILTAAQSGETRGMRWRELDLKAKVSTVPPERIKPGKEHRVPLTPAALALLGEAGEPDALVFPSPIRTGKLLLFGSGGVDREIPAVVFEL
jgi:integrase